MTTNQTIDGVLVPRELIEWLVTPGNVMDLGGRREELRALLDAPAKPEPSCIGDLERFESDGEDFVKVADVIDMLGNLKAAQPQGAHLGEIVEFGTGLKEVSWRKGKLPALGTKLYAEQPAPVAVVLAEAREWLGDGKHSDGLTREHWTPEYAALIDRIDATLRK